MYTASADARSGGERQHDDPRDGRAAIAPKLASLPANDTNTTMTAEVGVGSDVTVAPGAVRLLVVDDDVAICRQVASGLATAGFQVVTANDAAGAIAQADLTPPDVAIIDLGMPTTGGIEVIRHIKQQHGTAVHVIVLTGHDDERSRAEAFDAGTDDYVVKPIGLSEIKRRDLGRASQPARARPGPAREGSRRAPARVRPGGDRAARPRSQQRPRGLAAQPVVPDRSIQGDRIRPRRSRRRCARCAACPVSSRTSSTSRGSRTPRSSRTVSARACARAAERCSTSTRRRSRAA